MISTRSVIFFRYLVAFAVTAVPARGTQVRSQSQLDGDCDSRAIFGRAEGLLKSKHLQEARSTLRPLERCPALTPIARFNLGWLLGRSHDFKGALKIFEAVPAEVPNPAIHQYAIALTEFELSDYQMAAQTLSARASTGKLDSKSANLLAVSYSKLGRYQDAYSVLSDNIKQNPSDLFSYLNLITLLADAGHFSDAAKVADQAMAVFPNNPDVMVVRGAAHTLLGELNTAQADFAAAVQLSPRSPSARFFLALAEYRQGNYEGSAADLGTAIKSGIVDSDLYYLLAECLLKTQPEQTAATIGELNRAIALNAKAVAARTLRGKLVLQQGKLREAMVDLSLAHSLDPASRSAAYNLARADMKAGKTKEADALFRKLQSQTGDSLTELSQQKLQQALRAQGPQLK